MEKAIDVELLHDDLGGSGADLVCRVYDLAVNEAAGLDLLDQIITLLEDGDRVALEHLSDLLAQL